MNDDPDAVPAPLPGEPRAAPVREWVCRAAPDFTGVHPCTPDNGHIWDPCGWVDRPPSAAAPPPGERTEPLEACCTSSAGCAHRAPAPLPPGDDEPRRLVERLRAVNRVYPIAAVGEAADYIERLTAAPVPPPGGDEPRRSDLVGRLLDSLDAILDETLPTGDPAVDVDLAHLRVTELRVLLRDAPAPVLPPGVTLCRAADGTEFMVALGRDVPEGWGWSDDDGTEGWVTADGPVEAMPVTALRVRPPEPPSAPRTERVPWSETVGRRLPDGRQVYTAQHFEGEKPYIMTKGIPEAARHAVAPDGTVEVLALEPSDADQGEGS